MADCNFSYAICGGYALELFLNREIRSHVDIDIFIFHDDRKQVAKYFIDRDWQIYTSPKNTKLMIRATTSDDILLMKERCIYVMKSKSEI